MTGDSLFRETSVGGKYDHRFPDPFCDAASTVMPQTVHQMYAWCRFIVDNNGVYKEALRRVCAYFITDVEIKEDESQRIGSEEKESYENFLQDTLGIKSVLHAVAMDYLTFGNSFTSVIMPFRRYLSCKGCGTEHPLKRIFNTPDYNFRWVNFEFHAHCPHCGYTGVWRHIDRRSGEKSQIRVKRWAPQEIDVICDEYSEVCQYVWRIPENYRQQIRTGYLNTLENASWEVIQAVKNQMNLQFDQDEIYHMREEALAGSLNRGIGISRVLANFRIAWYLQLLWRFNEAIGLDYIAPFRALTPAARAGSGPESEDPVHAINLGGFVSRVQAMIRSHKMDPTQWHVLPFPLEYKALGGEANELAPKELIDQALDTLLSAIGIPVDFYKGNLTMQAAPPALRLMEANWSHLVHNLNVFISKLTQQVSRMLRWEPVTACLKRVTHADDLNRQMAKLQMMGAGLVSKGTGLESIGLRHTTETRKMLEEAQFESEEQQRMTEELQQKATSDELLKMLAPTPVEQLAQAVAGGGGAPPAAGGGSGGAAAAAPAGPQMTAVDQFIMQRQNNPNVPITPDELGAQAQGIAESLLVMGDAQRKGELAKLRKSDTVVHQLVTSILDQRRRQAASQGQQMVLQQMGKQGMDSPLSLHVDPRSARNLSKWVRKAA